MEQLYKRVLASVDKKTNAPCWDWTGATNENGAGVLKHGGVMYSPRRVVYEHRHGELPPGVKVDVKCDNRLCCNPRHLSAPAVESKNPLRAYKAARSDLQRRAVTTDELAAELGVTKWRIETWLYDRCSPPPEWRSRMKRQWGIDPESWPLPVRRAGRRAQEHTNGTKDRNDGRRATRGGRVVRVGGRGRGRHRDRDEGQGKAA